MKKLQRIAATLLAACAAAPTSAVELDLSGFGSAVAGRTFGQCTANAVASAFSSSCTRFVADWGHGGVYDEKWSAEPESRLGVQGTVRVNPQLSFTAQVVARAVHDPLAELEWAYMTIAPAPGWTLQLGRKRVPLFFYSDFQDVGFAYPWVRVPPDVYGWDVVNYNGANLTYNASVSGWALRSSAFAGSENSRKNGYSRILYDEPKDVKWSGIAGADLEFAKDWFTGRVVYMRSGFQQIDRQTGMADVQINGAIRDHHQAYGGSVNIDYGNFLLRSEVSVFDRSRYAYKATSWFVSGGYRFGNFTPMLTLSDYKETSRFPLADYEPARWSTVAASLRYDLGASSALKVQLERIRDRQAPFVGNATLLSMSYDFVF
ncbi:hypothetical protein WG902_12535 [Ramlibacter sp. PS3R-8]|uniref:hypothetical protein n=1 Tax=Ramlibacter sp. PS3R-8 TaxID=3133437 RepID=UPI0030AD1BDD